MSVTAVDTSVIVSALLSWHEFHDVALAALVTARDEPGGKLLVPAPALVEAYAVMTRLPAPHRLSPVAAVEILSGSFEDHAEIVSLSGSETWRFLHDTVGAGLTGGATYDALIVRCARQGRATSMLTLDRRDFERLPLAGITLVVPRTSD